MPASCILNKLRVLIKICQQIDLLIKWSYLAIYFSKPREKLYVETLVIVLYFICFHTLVLILLLYDNKYINFRGYSLIRIHTMINIYSMRKSSFFQR